MPIKNLICRLLAGFPDFSGFQFHSGLGDTAWLLYGLVRSMKPEVCVEIGSARGKSACFIGLALKHNRRGRLHAIDPHAATGWNDTDSVESLPLMARHLRMAGVREWVDVIQVTSADAARDWQLPIDMIFIDGDHSYAGVKGDWERFSPHLKETGIAVFHDTLWELEPDPRFARTDMGVPRFVEELRVLGYPVLTIARDYGVSVVQPIRGGMRLAGPHGS